MPIFTEKEKLAIHAILDAHLESDDFRNQARIERAAIAAMQGMLSGSLSNYMSYTPQNAVQHAFELIAELDRVNATCPPTKEIP